MKVNHFVKTSSVKVHTSIIERTAPSHKLWYLMKAANVSGSGRCFLPIEVILDVLQISKATLKRYYSDPDFFYQTYTVNSKPPEVTSKGYLVVYPVGINKVCRAYNIRDLGVISEINVEDIIHIKKFSALMAILDLQRRSRYLANKYAREKVLVTLNRKRAPKGSWVPALDNSNLDKLFSSPTEKSVSEISAGILKVEKKYLYINEGFNVFGGSQSTAASELQRCVKTVTRRLKGFEKLSVVKLAKDNLMTYHNLSEDWSYEASKFFMKGDYCFERLCSLYRPILHLFTAKCSRRRLSVMWSKLAKDSDMQVA